MKLLGIGLNANSLAVGAGAVLLSPIVLPAFKFLAGTVTKLTIKGGLLVSDGVKTYLTDTKNTVGNIIEEAKAEVQQQTSSK